MMCSLNDNERIASIRENEERDRVEFYQWSVTKYNEIGLSAFISLPEFGRWMSDVYDRGVGGPIWRKLLSSVDRLGDITGLRGLESLYEYTFYSTDRSVVASHKCPLCKGGHIEVDLCRHEREFMYKRWCATCEKYRRLKADLRWRHELRKAKRMRHDRSHLDGDTYVYFLQSDEAVKIGIAADIEVRMYQLKRKTPWEFSITGCVLLKTRRSALSLEKMMLQTGERYTQERFDGSTEWIIPSADTIRLAVENGFIVNS